MTLVFSSDFTGATNPALTPTPFSSVLEDANNDIKYHATNGVGGSPCAEIDFGGTNRQCAGLKTITAITPGSTRPAIEFAFRLQVSTMTSGQMSNIFRARSGATLVAFALVVGDTLLGTYKFRLHTSIGTAGGTTGSTLFTHGATYHTVKFVFDGPNDDLQLYVDGALEVTHSVDTTLSVYDDLTFGATNGNSAVILTTTDSWFYDNLFVEDGVKVPLEFGVAAASTVGFAVTGISPLEMAIGATSSVSFTVTGSGVLAAVIAATSTISIDLSKTNPPGAGGAAYGSKVFGFIGLGVNRVGR